jgi:hypothetical protein
VSTISITATSSAPAQLYKSTNCTTVQEASHAVLRPLPDRRDDGLVICRFHQVTGVHVQEMFYTLRHIKPLFCLYIVFIPITVFQYECCLCAVPSVVCLPNHPRTTATSQPDSPELSPVCTEARKSRTFAKTSCMSG